MVHLLNQLDGVATAPLGAAAGAPFGSPAAAPTVAPNGDPPNSSRSPKVGAPFTGASPSPKNVRPSSVEGQTEVRPSSVDGQTAGAVLGAEDDHLSAVSGDGSPPNIEDLTRQDEGDQEPATVVDFMWPDGNVCFTLPDENLSSRGVPFFGWHLDHMHTKKGVRHFQCFGVFICPADDCEFVARGRHPITKKDPKTGEKQARGLGKPPRVPKHTCPEHPDEVLEWVKCTGGPRHMATIKESLVPCILDCAVGTNVANHMGNHNHPRPPHNRLTPVARLQLHRVIRENPHLGPSQLVFGSRTRPSVAELHSSLGNRDLVKHEKKKALRDLIAGNTYPDGVRSTLGAFIQLIHDAPGGAGPGGRWVVHMDLLNHGQQTITMQPQFMKEILEKAEGGLQSDTIEGFICDNNWLDGTVDIHFTSAFDSILA